MCAYLHSEHRLESTRRIVALKSRRENALLKKYHKNVFVSEPYIRDMNDVLLWEARSARHFWRAFRSLLPQYPDFISRKPRAKDPVNRLLDVGYHHLANVVEKTLERLEIPTVLGILHAPRTRNSAPLVYDLMELFRADSINAELLRFMRLKKKRIVEVGQSEISHFLHGVNERMERTYYIRTFKACHTYRYYIELQLLKFVSAVNHHETFVPIHLPTRNDSRCRSVDTQAESVVGFKEESVP